MIMRHLLCAAIAIALWELGRWILRAIFTDVVEGNQW